MRVLSFHLSSLLDLVCRLSSSYVCLLVERWGLYPQVTNLWPNMGKAQGELPLWGKCKASPGVPSGVLLASHCLPLCHKPTKAFYHFWPLGRKAQVRRNGTGSAAPVYCNCRSWAAISENVDVHSSSDEALWPNAVPENFLRWWKCSLICVVQYCGCWPHVALRSLQRGLLWLRHWFYQTCLVLTNWNVNRLVWLGNVSTMLDNTNLSVKPIEIILRSSVDIWKMGPFCWLSVIL